MKRETLNNYLGQRVIVTFKDGTTAIGVLKFAKEFSSKYEYHTPNYYYIDNLAFKVSHVKKVDRFL